VAVQKKEWFDDDSFWREFYPHMFTEPRMAASEELARKVIKLAKPKGKDILDLCCGPGRYAVWLAKKRYRVTGVDRTKFLLTKARANVKKAGVKIEFVQKDMRDFVRPESFDLVLNIFTSFGYFENKNEDMLVLNNIYTSLRPGGTLVIDVMGKERLAKIFLPTVTDVLPDGTIIVQKHKVVKDWTRIYNEWLLIKKGKVRSFKFEHTIYSGQELRELLERAGFMGIKLYGNFKGDKYDNNAVRLIAVAKKPGHRKINSTRKSTHRQKKSE
jgi:SAM-dependent methyltransferase